MHEKVTYDTRSADGTAIAWHVTGEGPPLLLVHGSLGDHTRWDALRTLLEPHVTVHAMDRRGRGASGDAAAYAIEREYEDVAAVIDAIADSTGAPIAVYCSSFGGLCALGAYERTTNVARLALYEGWPPVHPAAHETPTATVARMEALLADGSREAALELAYRELVGLDEADLERIRRQPSWPRRIAAVHTITREMRAFDEQRFDADAARRVTAPTLLLIGSESPAWGPEAPVVAAALPDARIAVLDGQGHAADLLAPELVAERLLPFVLASR
ncbi:MAG: alpha/beta fold hydrolase [Nocardiopsis sp. BM-2018]|nr:MAG: alpha/beta fold hydrolase [Nocardiopsis sp. BM-2018]